MHRFKYILCSYLSVYDNLEKPCRQVFKYILCSYLSRSRCRQQGNKCYLNTSYVLIYRPYRVEKVMEDGI